MASRPDAILDVRDFKPEVRWYSNVEFFEACETSENVFFKVISHSSNVSQRMEKLWIQEVLFMLCRNNKQKSNASYRLGVTQIRKHGSFYASKTIKPPDIIK